jgi:plasmid maintenance system antidote protein VapI
MLAKEAGFSDEYMRRVVAGTVEINPVMANQLGQLFGTDPDFWINLQRLYHEVRRLCGTPQ